MDILQTIENMLNGVLGSADIPDPLLALILILGIIIALRIARKAVSTAINLGCMVIGIALILWVVLSLF